MTDRCWDVLTLGETMIRLTPPAAQRLEQAAQFDVYVGGSEANVAVGLARLGLRSAWVGRLPDNPLGRRVSAALGGQGVDVSGVIWANEGRVGVYYLEVAGAPRGSRVIYDRQGSAASKLRAQDLDWTILSQTRHFHVSGITAALSASCAEVVRQALAEAQRRGATTSVDINYRSRLWSPQSAREVLQPLLGVDLVFCTAEDATTVFGVQGPPSEVAERLRHDWGAKMVVLTLGSRGALVCSADGLWQGKSHEVDPVDRVGAGDAYVAGFLYGYVDADIDKAVAYGGAMAAWKYSEPGDFCWATSSDIETMLAEAVSEIRR